MSKLDKLIAELCPDGVDTIELCQILKIRNGKDYKRIAEGDIPVYGSGGIITHINQSAYDKPSVLIPRKGSIDKLYYVDVPFWTVDTIFYTEINNTIVESKYVFYFLQSQHIERFNTAGGVPSLTQAVLNKILIPLPPLPVQREIVRILDNFTELTAELTARKKQYEYCRNLLLTCGDDVEWRTLGDICSMKAGTAIPAIEISNIKNEDQCYPCYGGNGLRGYVKTFNRFDEASLIGRQGALCGNVCFAIDKYYATEHAIVVGQGKYYNARFLYYLLTAMN